MSVAGLRLLMTADAVGGVWQYATALAEALLPLGVRPTLALLGPAPDDAQRALVPDGVALIETGLPLDWLADSSAAVRAAGRAITDLAQGHDVLQLNSPALAAGGPGPVPVIAVAHGCLATWWEAAHGGSPPADLAWQVELNRAGLRAATAVVAPTLAYAEKVQRQYGLTQRPIPIHNGRAPLRTADAAPALQVFTAGRLWDRVKATDLLDDVAGTLSVPFHAAGSTTGPHGETINPRHLDLLGSLDQGGLARCLAARPVFVSAARFEPFGLAVLEAAQAGCPLVLSDIATFRELWDGAALFVAPGDASGFTAAIERLLADPTLHQQLGRAAQARATRYTPQATAAAMAALFGRLVERRAAA